MCCTRLAEKYRTQKIAKNSPSAHHRTLIVGLYLRNEGTYRQSEQKLVKHQYLHNMVNFGSLAAEIGPVLFGAPQLDGFRI